VPENEAEVGPYSERENTYRSRQQILDDPDLYGLLVNMYRELGEAAGGGKLSERAEALEAARGESEGRRRSLLHNILDADKRPRREFAVRARQFMAERAAGRAAEEGRLRRAPKKRKAGRVSQTIQSTATALGLNATQVSAQGRTARVLELGQGGVLG